MKKVDLAYMAGFFDGEGCISLCERSKRKRQLRVHISISNTNEWIIQWFKFNFGGSVTSERKQLKNPNWRDTWRWNITSGAHSVRFLKEILPYLRLKKPQAELAIAFQVRHSQIGKRIKSETAILDMADRILMKKLKGG